MTADPDVAQRNKVFARRKAFAHVDDIELKHDDEGDQLHIFVYIDQRTSFPV